MISQTAVILGTFDDVDREVILNRLAVALNWYNDICDEGEELSFS